jgi:hypothetical protein
MARLFDIFLILSLLILALPLGIIAQSSPSTTLAKWRYLGCYNETIDHPKFGGERALYEGISESLPIMTVRMCIRFCDSNDYLYAGVEYAQYVSDPPFPSGNHKLTLEHRECYCSLHISSVSARLDQSDCDLPCAGNSSEMCGGHLKLGVFHRKSVSGAAGLKPPGLVNGAQGSVGSLLALGVAVVALLYLAW